MNVRVLVIIAAIVVVSDCKGFTQEKLDNFYPTVLWENNAERGVILVGRTEMLIVDSKGDKCGKVFAKEDVYNVYIAPDGKKLAYATATGIWLVKIETGQSYLVTNGYCHYLHWSTDSLSFLFVVGTNIKDGGSPDSNVKVFWADGDGKNLKQVYP